MNSIAINQILILLLQCFIVAVLLLSLFRLRTIFGLGLLFTALGVFQYLQVFLVSSLYIEIMPGILVSPGSMVLFTGSIFAILLIYIREDALEARKVIYALVAANLALTLLQVVFGWSIDGEGINNIYNLPKEFFTQNAFVLLIGSIILFIDAVAIIFIYELISRFVSLLFLRIFFSAVLILSLDSLLFSLLAFYGTEQFSSVFISGLIAKISAALLYSALFSFYLLYLDKSFGKNKILIGSYEDIFNSLTFRQKYEQVSKEKESQEIELQKSKFEHEISEEKFRSMFELSPDAINLTGNDGTIINCNQTLIEMFGFADKSEVIGTNFRNLFAKEDLQHAVEKERQASSGVEIRNEEHLLRKKDGTIFAASISASAIMEEDGTPKYVLGVARDITESKQAEEILKQTHERLTDTLESMSDGFVSLDKNWIYTNVNNRAAEMLGRKQEDLIGKHIWTEFPEGIDQPFYKTYFKVAETQKEISFEDFYAPLNRWYKEQVIPTKDGLAIFFKDITERKMAEETLKQTHERLTDSLESMSDGFVSLDKNWVYTYVNERAAEMFGRKPEDLIGKHIWTEFPEGIDQPFYKTYYKVVETQKQISFQDYYAPWDCWFENQVIPTKDGLSIFFQDITDRKQVSEAIHESESRLKEAQRIAKIGSWELDLITNKLSWSDEVYRIFDLEPQQFEATYEAFLANIHPDDRDRVNLAYTESVKNKTPYEIVHRLLLKDGTIKYVKEHSKTFYNDSGKAIRSFGTVQDITAIKQISLELESKTDLIETLIQTIPDLIWLKDTEGVYLKCNKGLERLYGAKEADILGKTDYDFVDKKLADFFRKNDRKAQEANKPTINEEFLSFADGSYEGWFETTKTPMFSKEGKNIGVLGIARDINRRKKYDEEINKLNNELEQKIKERMLDLEKKNKTLEKMNKVFVGRELRMAELKKEIETLKKGE